MEQQSSRLMTVKQAAKALNVSTFSLYRKINNGMLPAFRLGRKVLIDLNEILTAMRTGSTS